MVPMLAEAGGGGGSGFLALIYIVLLVAVVMGVYAIFEKADQPGWAAIIPIYNYYIMTKVVGRPGWWVILGLIPIVNLVVAVIIYNDLSASFGKGPGYVFGLILLPFVFLPMLGFGDARYQGPAAA